ncbi:efflux RND transporter periplasmic adaptor subunit [Cytophaga aurantiaca]|uniref:efflux RND transporter periplasmic adaptor subunit n=1 Tax=Cytophaga aurantiaca TaxID=29530 RepID=UPI0003624A26|nr:efflux RND transporter periplasmic adaptor subunit [Cytophaga aurantiaca]
MKKIFYLALSLSILFASCHSPESPQATNVTAVPVTISTVISNSQHVLSLSGKVESTNSATISTRMMGYVEQVLVDVGDNVKKGQLLVRINSAELTAKKAQVDAMIAETSAALKSAQKDVDRFTRLHDQKSATDKEYEQVMLQFESIKAKNEAAIQMRNEVEAMQQFTSIKAPYDGQITQKITHVGDLANPGMPLLMMEQQGALSIVTMIPEKNRMSVKEGTKALIEIISTHQTFETEIENVSLSSTNSGGQYIAKLSIPAAFSKSVFPGMYSIITLNNAETAEAGLFVPTKCIIQKDQLAGVYVYSNHKAYLRWLKIGEEKEEYTEVLTGVKVNDTIILSSEAPLLNGSIVQIK